MTRMKIRDAKLVMSVSLGYFRLVTVQIYEFVIIANNYHKKLRLKLTFSKNEAFKQRITK